MDDDTVILSNVQSGTSAVYQCNASNEFGYLLANAFVNVLGEPRWTLRVAVEMSKGGRCNEGVASFRSRAAQGAHAPQPGVPGHQQQPGLASLRLLRLADTNHHMVRFSSGLLFRGLLLCDALSRVP